MTSWAALLDAIDEGLTSSPPVLPDFVPGDFGALPANLAARATSTLHRMAEVEVALQRDQAELARELAALSAAKGSTTLNAASPVPHFLDTKA
jgi:hypothetical protein